MTQLVVGLLLLQVPLQGAAFSFEETNKNKFLTSIYDGHESLLGLEEKKEFELIEKETSNSYLSANCGSGLPPEQAVQVYDYSVAPDGADFDCLVACGVGDTISLLIVAPKEDVITNITVRPQIPEGMMWDGYVGTPDEGSVSVLDSDPESPVFSVSSLGPGQSGVVLEYTLTYVGCSSTLGALSTDVSFTYCAENYTNNIPYPYDLNNAIATPEVSVNCNLAPNATFTNFNETQTFGPIRISNTGDACSHLQSVDVVYDFEAGIEDYTLDAIRVNGITMPTADYTFDALTNDFSFSVDGNLYFAANGNESIDNNLMEQGEYMDIEIDFTLLPDCPDNIQTPTIIASFGCDDICQADTCSNNGLRTNLDFNFDLTHSVALQDTDFSNTNSCGQNQIDFSVSTSATPNQSPQADYYNIEEIAIELPVCFDSLWAVNGVNLNGNALADSLYSLEKSTGISNPLENTTFIIIKIEDISTDIDGAGGLEDLNGDGLYNDLPAGNTLTGDVPFGLSCAISANCPVITSCAWEVNGYRIGPGTVECSNTYEEEGTYVAPTPVPSIAYEVEIEDILDNTIDTMIVGGDGKWDDLFVDATDGTVDADFTVFMDYGVDVTAIDLTGCSTPRYFYKVDFDQMSHYYFDYLEYVAGSTTFDGTPVADVNVTFTKDAATRTAQMLIETGDNLTNLAALRRYQFDLRIRSRPCGGIEDLESLITHSVYETCDDAACCETLVKACATQFLHVDLSTCGVNNPDWTYTLDNYRYNYEPNGSGDAIPLTDRKRALMYDTMAVDYAMYHRNANAADENIDFDSLGFLFNFYPGSDIDGIESGDLEDEGWDEQQTGSNAIVNRINERVYHYMNHRLKALPKIQASFYDADTGTWTDMDCSSQATLENEIYHGISANSPHEGGLADNDYAIWSGIGRTDFEGYLFLAEFTDCMDAMMNKSLAPFDTLKLTFLFEILPNPNPYIGCDEFDTERTGWNQLQTVNRSRNNRSGDSGPFGLLVGQDPYNDEYPLRSRPGKLWDYSEDKESQTFLEVACNRMFFEQQHTVDACETDVEVKMIPGIQMNDGVNNPLDDTDLDTIYQTSYKGDGAPTFAPLDEWFTAERRFNLRVDTLFIPLPTGAIYTTGSGMISYLDTDEVTVLNMNREPIIINTQALMAGATTYNLADPSADWHLLVDITDLPDMYVGDNYQDFITYKYSYTTICPAPEVVDSFRVHLEQLACEDFHYQMEYYQESEENIQNGNLGDQKIFIADFAPMTATTPTVSRTTNPGSAETIEFDVCNTGVSGTHADYDFTGALLTIPNGVSLTDLRASGGGSLTYSVHQTNADGSIVYYFDNPTTSLAVATCWEFEADVTFDYCLPDIYNYEVKVESFASCIPAADFKDLPTEHHSDCVSAITTHQLQTPEPCQSASILEGSGSPVALCDNIDMIFLAGNTCAGETQNTEFTVYLPQGLEFVSPGLEYDLAGNPSAALFSAGGAFATPTVDVARSGGGFTAYTLAWDADLGQGATMPGNTNVAFRATFSTTCDFISGLPVRFQQSGLDNCDREVNSDLLEEDIFILGAEFEDLVTVVSDFYTEGVTCGDVVLCFNGVIIPKSNASISTSTIITIPQEFNFTDITWVVPATTGNYTQTTDPAGNTLVEVNSPIAQGSYESYGFYVNINVPSNVGCGDYTLSHYTVGKVDLTCPADPSGSCEISGLLGGDEEIISMAPKMGIDEAAVNFTCSGDPADMTYEVLTKNISQDTLTDIPYDLNLYSDADGDGELNPAIDNLLGATSGTISGTLLPGDNQTLSGTFSGIPINQACDVLLEFLPDTGCGCDSTSIKPTIGVDLGLPITDGKIDACNAFSFDACGDVSFSVEPADAVTLSQTGSTVTITMNPAYYGPDPLTFTLTSSFGDCAEVTETFEMGCCVVGALSIGSYTDTLTRGDSLVLAVLGASSAINPTFWSTSGDGLFDNGTNAGTFGLSQYYTPGPNDKDNEQVTLTLFSLEDGCCASASASITIPIHCQSTATIADVLKCTDNSETITVVPDGGTGPYTYTWSGPYDLSSESGNEVITSVPGIYTVTVTDREGCTVTTSGEMTFQSKICLPVTITIRRGKRSN